MLQFLFGLVSVNKISSDNPRGYYFVVLVLVVIVVIDVTDVVLFEFHHTSPGGCDAKQFSSQINLG